MAGVLLPLSSSSHVHNINSSELYEVCAGHSVTWTTSPSYDANTNSNGRKQIPKSCFITSQLKRSSLIDEYRASQDLPNTSISRASRDWMWIFISNHQYASLGL